MKNFVAFVLVVLCSLTGALRYVREEFSSPVEECLNEEEEGEAKSTEFVRGQLSTSDRDACSGHSYERGCLESAIPLSASYTRIKACFRCCVYFWTEKWDLSENMGYWKRMGFLHSGNNVHRIFEHNQTEVLLTANSLMKFAHVALTADLYHPTLPDVGDNSVVDVGGHLEIDPRHGQRPCVKKHAGRCDVKDGGVIFCHTFDNAPKLFKNASSWASLGKNISVLFVGDQAINPGEDVAGQVAEKGLRMFQHNARTQNMDFPIVGNTLHPVDGLMFPVGMSPATSPEASGDFLTRYRRGPAEKTRLLFCGGINIATKSEPIRNYRGKVVSSVNHRFNCKIEDNLEPENYFGNISTSKFALSPRGGGLNCYRTWEILAVGTIPVIEYHPANDNLYSGLPVVQVTDWNDVTPDFLGREWSRIMSAQRAGQFSPSHAKAFLPYWLSIIYGNATGMT
uniref:Exostosin GT47 domain-containing protein n=1 Tax=Noctiluca scintillans TaxID=2966 RepID=A0A7S0ZX53_NOCSC|mmetsp:Transcript_22675/g.59807  ORF Transcript_22675/g.59807 Transcript_22675/m.59807 type:complete len:453 (+) Transcript_22675:62-1420(+)